MRCVVDGCRNPAVCRFCRDHRPLWLPLDLERPTAGPDDDTVDLKPIKEAEPPQQESV